ncbi:MAG: DUF2799 domain-containing protein [Candidatus Competibacteraceae bacterium]|nr:DUF2799 domain-containing protein [Candidatus Contendobacter odensis]MBK8537046.1 DUF2799 domain-containing protein [Candidatus Competibacteraceae bacterium]MBK8754454.1 DUF2799 domain-containing protein [Candidatus Competibacteraceae bacterium]
MSRIGNDNSIAHRQPLRCILLGLSGALTLSGCTTLSREDCLSGDWYAIGVQDGASGYSLERLAEHRQACAEYRIRPDREDYRAGWEDGIRDYCTPQRGFREGRQGASYAGVCPPQLEWIFLREYRIGQELYEQERRIRELEREQERKKEERREREEHRRSDQRREKPEVSRQRDIQPVGQPVHIQPSSTTPPDDPAEQEKLRNEMQKVKEQFNRLREQSIESKP